MKAWIKGAILGFIWSILGFIVEIPIKKIAWLEIIFFFPILIAKLLGFVNIAAFVGGPLVGIIIGSFIGFFYDLRKEQKRTGKIELKLSYWQKGAVLGVIWSLLGFGVDFIFEYLYTDLVGLPDIIGAPLVVFYFMVVFPNILASLFRISILGPLAGFSLGAVVGYVYGRFRGER